MGERGQGRRARRAPGGWGGGAARNKIFFPDFRPRAAPRPRTGALSIEMGLKLSKLRAYARGVQTTAASAYGYV